MYSLYNKNSIINIPVTRCLSAIQRLFEYETRVDLINGKRVLAPEKDILEVKNAIELYDNLTIFNPFEIESLLKAHKILMQGLIIDNGY